MQRALSSLMRRAGKETEIKLAVASAPALRRRLRALGFHPLGPRQQERNTIWDTPKRLLKKRGCLLRLRTVGGQGWITFKGPRQRQQGFKVRVEWETEVALAASAEKILQALGYQPVFRYEKFRTTYTQRGRRGGEALLDETPIGAFLELEGAQAWIGRVARQFGYAPKNFITKTYGELYLAWCRRRRQPPGDMVFRRRRTSL